MSAKKKTDSGNIELTSEMTPEELEAAANLFLEQADAELEQSAEDNSRDVVTGGLYPDS